MPAALLSDLWTLSCRGVTTAAAGIGVSGITRKRASQSADTCVVRFDGRAFDAAPPFAFGDIVTVSRGGAPWFVGRVTSLPASGDGQAESQECELSGPWWYLAQLVYQQLWTIQGGAATASLGRVVLGQAADGTPLTTGQVIADALQYAIDAGAPFAIGSIDPAFPAPLDEVKDITCAEVIRKMLRWHPGGVAWFDYTTSPVPTFHCRTRPNLPAATLTVGVPPLAAVRGLTARPDLLASAVLLHFETTRSVSGQVQTDVVTDAAPAGATGREFGAVVATIPLRGGPAVVLSQRIETQAISTDPGHPDTLAQLIDRSPALAVYAADPAVAAAGITITSLNITPAGEIPAATPASPALNNELVEGEITDWMAFDYGVQVQRQRMAFSYVLGGGTPEAGTPLEGSVDLTATDAASGLYTTLSTARAGDAAPTGLAAAFHAVLSALQYSGTIVLVEPEAGGTPAAGLGGVINLAGGAVADWTAMRAVVVAETVDVADGTTTLTLGPVGRVGLTALLPVRDDVPVGNTAALGTASSASRATGTPG